MKRFKAIAVAVFSLVQITPALAGDYVQGYVRKDGTYVQPYYRSDADSSKLNNYGTQGNYNPYTGQKGTANPYATPNNGTGGSNNLFGLNKRNY